MNGNKVRIGVLGCSSIAERSTIPALLESGLFELTAVGSRTPDKAERLAEKFSCQASNYDDVITHPEIDAIYVPLPSGLHFEWGKKVLEAGKHLLMEKPFVDTYERAEELLRIAATKGLVAMEGLTYVYHPLIQKVHELVQNNEIGPIRLVETSFGFPGLPADDIRHKPELGGGAILDNLIYPLSLSLHLLGVNYKNIHYYIIEDARYGVDARGFLRMDWPEASAHINYGFDFFYRNTFTIWGQSGVIEVDRAFTRPKDMTGEIILKKNGHQEMCIPIEPANQFGETVKAFYNKIYGIDKSGTNENLDILSRMKVISEMYQSFLNRKVEV